MHSIRNESVPAPSSGMMKDPQVQNRDLETLKVKAACHSLRNDGLLERSPTYGPPQMMTVVGDALEVEHLVDCRTLQANDLPWPKSLRLV